MTSDILIRFFVKNLFSLILFSVGRPKHVRVMAGAVEGEYFVGKKAEELRGLLKIKYPVEHGIVKDWMDMENIWNYTYSELRCQAEEVMFISYLVLTIYSSIRPNKFTLIFTTFNRI